MQVLSPYLLGDQVQSVKTVAKVSYVRVLVNITRCFFNILLYLYSISEENRIKIVVGKVIVAKAIEINILYIGIIHFVINGRKQG